MHHPRDQNNTRVRALLACACLAIACVTSSAQALEVAGVEVPASGSVDGERVALNGAGLRSRFFVKVYVGALYLVSPGADSTQTVLERPGAKRVSMHMIYDELTQKKITDAWMDGFKGNTPEAELAAMMPRVERFNALWPALKAGDTVHVDFPPGKGVRLSVNGEVRGDVEGDDLQRAVLRIWLGDDPADGDLKRGMLGGG
jgi:hypothetical protein